MVIPEHAKLIPVTGNNDKPDLRNAVEVQFNPATLKVSLANTLKENPRSGNTRSAQYVDKSSSSLSVELIFDTTFIDTSEEDAYRGRAATEGRNLDKVEAGSDVRLLTKRIAEKFLKPVADGKKLKAPGRCLFQWGAFEFLGLVQSFEETLDFFAPEGVPLRATVSLKLSEDRYQFRSNAMNKAERDTPTLASTGNTDTSGVPIPGGAGGGLPVPGSSGDGSGNWRNTALFNGIESPRLPSAPVLAVPPAGAEPGGLAGSGLPGAGAGAPTAASSSNPAGPTTNPASAAPVPPTPGYTFGNSSQLGTAIPGAFPVGTGGGPSAGSLASGGNLLRANPGSGSANPGSAPAASAPSGSTTSGPGPASRRSRIGPSVGFD